MGEEDGERKSGGRRRGGGGGGGSRAGGGGVVGREGVAEGGSFDLRGVLRIPEKRHTSKADQRASVASKCRKD